MIKFYGRNTAHLSSNVTVCDEATKEIELTRNIWTMRSFRSQYSTRLEQRVKSLLTNTLRWWWWWWL